MCRVIYINKKEKTKLIKINLYSIGGILVIYHSPHLIQYILLIFRIKHIIQYCFRFFFPVLQFTMNFILIQWHPRFLAQSYSKSYISIQVFTSSAQIQFQFHLNMNDSIDIQVVDNYDAGNNFLFIHVQLIIHSYIYSCSVLDLFFIIFFIFCF